MGQRKASVVSSSLLTDAVLVAICLQLGHRHLPSAIGEAVLEVHVQITSDSGNADTHSFGQTVTNEDEMTKLSAHDLKDQAKRLRTALEGSGKPVSHSQALELVAKQNGYRDWNTAKATAPLPASNHPAEPFNIGDAVSGQYLGQHFTGQIKGVTKMGDYFRVRTVFDAPVDVVTFDSFTNFRTDVWATVDATGVSPQKTSDGKPQMRLSV